MSDKMHFKLNPERIIIIILIAMYLITVPARLARNECINVEGETTTLLDLAKSPHKESYIERQITDSVGERKEFFQLILTSEMVGTSDVYVHMCNAPDANPFFSYNFYHSSIFPVKLSKKSKPFFTGFRLYEFDNECYIQVYYAVDKARYYYMPVYKYTDIDLEEIKELSTYINF